MSARLLLAAGIALAVLGMTAAFLGITAPGVFVAATRVILLGLLVCAAAGVYALARAHDGQDEA